MAGRAGWWGVCPLPLAHLLCRLLQAGDIATNAEGFVVYRANHDYFNCPASSSQCGAPDQTEAASQRQRLSSTPDSFNVRVINDGGDFSAEAEQLVWVRNRNDAPRLVGHAAGVQAPLLGPVPLPPLRLSEPDADELEWDVLLSASVGFVTIRSAALESLWFIEGQGIDDRVMRFRGLPSVVNAALGAATYRAVRSKLSLQAES
jgi:hypothetical protein